MSEMDGITLIRKLRAILSYRFIQIVMLTTESQEEKKNEGKAAGARRWIDKLFRTEQLLVVVKKALG
jgi:two-component system chemotaxis response regulator CheY